MNLIQTLTAASLAGIQEIWGKTAEASQLSFSETNKEIQGDFTLVTFPLAKLGLGKPPEIAEKLGTYLVAQLPDILSSFQVVQGFLNLTIQDSFWKNQLLGMEMATFLRNKEGAGQRMVVEFSSPNTNKPLHLGHCRNNFLGYAICQILEANGFDVKRVCLVNDRGIAICKSMLMYQKYGNGATPESTGKKPDHFVVQYYVRFDQENGPLAEALLAANPGMDKDAAKTGTTLYLEAQELLRKWESGDPGTLALWKQMNDWVYQGFEGTYEKMGIWFHKTYYESQTWTLGNALVDEGLAKGIFFRRPDGAIAIDLTGDGLDQKVLRRSDGTSIYITQDLGTAVARQAEWGFDRGMYVVGDEQDYHFKVLFLILQKLGYSWAHHLFHLSYGMVDLPGGAKMKTRTGTTVDADDLMAEMVQTAKAATEELGKTAELSESEKTDLHEKIGMAALKYFILRVDPRKRMVFDPKESVDLHGHTGPFIQYSYARTRALARKAGEEASLERAALPIVLENAEKALIRVLTRYPEVLRTAASRLDPSEIANYCFELAKEFNRFYDQCSILKAEGDGVRDFRLVLSARVAETLKAGLDLLGIQVPERM